MLNEFSYGISLQVFFFFLIQPTGEPREQHLVQADQKSSSYTKFRKRQTGRKGQYTQDIFKKSFKS